MSENEKVAVLGAGVIGASWASLFLASGRSVAVYDPAPNAEAFVRSYVTTAWPVLQELGLVKVPEVPPLTFHASPAEAVRGAVFVQESVPEKIELKHALYRDIEDALSPDAVVSSSASGLTMTEMQGGWKNPARFVLGHPFNPPHLVPLVEVMGNDRTAPASSNAPKIYAAIGKVTIRVRREIPAMSPTAAGRPVAGGDPSRTDRCCDGGRCRYIHLGRAGLRWAAMGPNLLFHLAAGEGGLGAYCERYGPSFNRWWDDLGQILSRPRHHQDAGGWRAGGSQGSDPGGPVAAARCSGGGPVEGRGPAAQPVNGE